MQWLDLCNFYRKTRASKLLSLPTVEGEVMGDEEVKALERLRGEGLCTGRSHMNYLCLSKWNQDGCV